MSDLNHLLKDSCVPFDFYWKEKGVHSDLTVWDRLAEVNAIHAAVSANDEEGERKKSQRVIDFLMPHLHEGIILDLGCGYGRIAKYLLSLHSWNGYIGLDSSVNMLRLFFNWHNLSDQKQQTPLLLLQSAMDRILLKDSRVDAVIVSAVFLHNHKSVTKRSIQEILRIMKPGAKLFVVESFPNVFNLAGLQGVLYLRLLKILGKEFKNGPVRYFSRREVYGFFSSFKRTEIIPVGFCVFPKSILIFPDFLNVVYRKLFYQPGQYLLEQLFPDKLKRLFCGHYDVIAYKQ